MDDNARLKIKVGPHEFEATGPAEVVQAQFEAFKQLIAMAPAAPSAVVAPPNGGNGMTPKLDPGVTDSALDKIMKVDNRIVSFTVPPKSAEDALLLLLYGQKVLRANEAVSGTEVVEGLATTGVLARRPDRLLEKTASAGDVIVLGTRRAKRYRLTNVGLAKARQLANDLIALVA